MDYDTIWPTIVKLARHPTHNRNQTNSDLRSVPRW